MNFKQLIARKEPLLAANVTSALSAKLAAAAGLQALYLGGGPLGYLNCGTEANIALQELITVGLDVRAVTDLPLALDGTCGWGDPMHMHRTIGLSEAAGFCAIEIEDQPLPKRAHHHIGIEHLIPTELMVAKVKECLAARRNPDFVIIARSNAARCESVDEAVRRGEAYHKAGADMLFILPGKPEDIRFLGERLPAPLMFMTNNGGFESLSMSLSDMAGLGYKYIVDPMTPVLAMHKALKSCYDAMGRMAVDPLLGPGGHASEHQALNRSIDLESLLAIERATVER